MTIKKARKVFKNSKETNTGNGKNYYQNSYSEMYQKEIYIIIEDLVLCTSHTARAREYVTVAIISLCLKCTHESYVTVE